MSVFEVGIGFSVFFKAGSVFGIGISKYCDIGIGIFPHLHYFKSVHSLSVHGSGRNCRTSAICTLLYNVTNVHCKVAGIMRERESK